MQTKLQFFQQASQLHHRLQRGKQVAMKTKDYKKLHVTVILGITANGNKLPT
jgi:hypothetical protein